MMIESENIFRKFNFADMLPKMDSGFQENEYVAVVTCISGCLVPRLCDSVHRQRQGQALENSGSFQNTQPFVIRMRHTNTITFDAYVYHIDNVTKQFMYITLMNDVID